MGGFNMLINSWSIMEVGVLSTNELTGDDVFT